ncbi:MAG: OmpA family protein [Xanthomonadaceae bacterium]|nr:OmpA family protein [Xanthomonadaceae bacterium]
MLDSLEFEPGTSRFSKHAATDLDKLFWLLVSNPGMQVLITGHTDNQGETEALQQLSQERAMKVVLYLVLNKGIDASRLRYAGKGSTEPLDSNDTPAGRARNNRIEVDIILK